jgi:predicted RNase H-like HicB family nuclease
MTELIFEVQEEGAGYSAHALGFGIHTQAETIEELRENVREAINCYFDEGAERPRIVRLHFVRDEVMVV